MENIEFIHLWKAQNDKLEKTLAINQMLLKEVINNKAQSSLKSLIRLKTAGIIAFILYISLLGYGLFFAISHYSSAWNYFIVSVTVIFLVNVKGLADYIKHLIWTNNISYNGSILEIQEQLSRLQMSIIQHSKYMCLQFPFYSTFYLTDIWFPKNVGAIYITFQILMTGGLAYFSYWLFKLHTPENFNKKWFLKMMEGSGNKSVREAMAFYQEIEDFKKE